MKPAQRYTLSLLERLQQEGSRRGQARAQSRGEEWKDLVESIRRNLNALFNTRRPAGAIPEEFSNCANSLLSFGLPDLSSYSPANPADRDTVRVAIQQAIVRFEPRLSSVRVIPEPRDPLIPHLRFRVHALLSLGTTVKQISFDTVLHTGDGLVVIQEAQ